MAARGDEGRCSLRKGSVRWQTTCDPDMSEWGNPPSTSWVSHTESIGVGKRTGRTETSKYPEEKKSTEIPPVAASERGVALKHVTG